MLTVTHLQQYTERIKSLLPGINRAEVAVVKDDLEKFMKDHKESQNILMLALLPEHGVAGGPDAAMWGNTCGFFFMIKTDYSSLKHADYLKLFADTQLVARAFCEQLIIDKADNYSCGMFAHLDEGSISAGPIKGLNQCNGYYVEFTFKSAM